MTYEEAVAILGEDQCALIRERLGPPKPLTPAQITVLVGLLSVDTDADIATDNVA